MKEEGLRSRNVQGQIPVCSLTSSSINSKAVEPCFHVLLLKIEEESNSIYLIGLLWISELKYARPLEQYVTNYGCFRGVRCYCCSIEENCSSERLETNYPIGFLVFSSSNKQNTGVLFFFFFISICMKNYIHWVGSFGRVLSVCLFFNNSKRKNG